MNDLELFMTEAYDEGVVTEVIRPGGDPARGLGRAAVLVELAMRDAHGHGVWHAQPTLWRRFDRPWDGPSGSQGSALLRRHDAGRVRDPDASTRSRSTARPSPASAHENGWTVESLCDEALGFGGLDLASCPRAELAPPPKPFQFTSAAIIVPWTADATVLSGGSRASGRHVP